MRPHFGMMLWRWRPRFGLRAMFLALTVVCVLLGVEGVRYYRESRALRALQSRGWYAATTRWFGRERHYSMFNDVRLWPFEQVTKIGVSNPIEYADLMTEFAGLEYVWIDFDVFEAAEFQRLCDMQRAYPKIKFKEAVRSIVPRHLNDPEWSARRDKQMIEFENLQIRLGILDN